MKRKGKSVLMRKMKKTVKVIILMVLVGVYPASYSIAAPENLNGDVNKNKNGTPARETNEVDWVNAVSMGVDNTGQNDCSVLVQELLNTYSTLYFPKGNYRFNEGITVGSNKTILGESDRMLYDDVDSGGTFFNFYNTSGYAIQSTDGAYNITLKNFCMMGNYSGGGGIRLYATAANDKFHKLEHLRVSNFSLNNIFLDSICEPILFDVQSSGSNENGLVSQSYGSKITNCQFYSNKQSGMKFTTGGALVTSCKVWSNGLAGEEHAGILLADWSHAIQLTGCAIHENYHSGLVLSGPDVMNNVVSGASFIGNNKLRGVGYDIVLDGSYNIINGGVTPTMKYGTVYASSLAVVKVQPDAKMNDVNLIKSESLYQEQSDLFFHDKVMLGEKIVLNECNNTMNHIVVNNTEFNYTPSVTDLNGAIYTEFEVNGSIGSSYENDILNVTLAANDTLPAAEGYGLADIGQTGIKVTLLNPVETTLIKDAYVEFEIKMDNYDNSLGICSNGYFSAGGVTYWLAGNGQYKKNGVVVCEDWIKIKNHVSFGTPVTPQQFNLLLFFVANTEGSAACRTGNSLSMRNFKITVN